jgi:hypothetical protein
MAQEMLSKKWGMMETDKELDDITLQQYLDIYRKPLSHSAIQAVRKLTEMAAIKKKKKRVAHHKTKQNNSKGIPKGSKGKKAATAS